MTYVRLVWLVLVVLALAALVFFVRTAALEPLGVVPKALSFWELLLEAGLVVFLGGLVTLKGTGSLDFLAGHAAATVRRFGTLPPVMRIASFAALYFLVNLLLLWRGVYTQHLYRYFAFVGAVNGVVLSIIAVSVFSHGLQRAVLAFVSGLTIQELGAKETAARKLFGALASMLRDSIHQAGNMIGAPADPRLQYLEQAATVAVLSALGVVAISFIFNWCWTALSEGSLAGLGSRLAAGTAPPPAAPAAR